MKFCKEIDTEENNLIYNRIDTYDMNEFIENDVFMRQWMTLQVEYVLCIIINIVSYMTTQKNDDNFEIDSKLVNKILHNILRSKMVSEDKILKVPNFFYEIIRRKSNKFSGFKFIEIGFIVSIIWQYITNNILLLKTDNQHKIKLSIYKMDLILSSKQKCIGITDSITENEIDDCICLAIFSLINSMKKITEIKHIDKDEKSCIESILLKKYNKIKGKENEDVENENVDEKDEEENDEEENEDGRFKKYDVIGNGDCFYLAIYNSLKKTSDGKYLKLLAKCLKEKYDFSINTVREDSFTDDLRKIMADNINIETFYNSLKETKEVVNANETIKIMTKDLSKSLKTIVIKYFIDKYNDSEEHKASFIEAVKNHIKTPRNWVSGDLEVVFLVDLLDNCDINVQIQKDKKNFSKSIDDNTIYLLNNNDSHYEFVIWKDDDVKSNANVFDREKEIEQEIKKDIERDEMSSSEIEMSDIFNPEEIIKQYEEEEKEEKEKISDKRQISILSLYFKKHNIDIDPKSISEIINTFKNSKIPSIIKYARINFFVFKNFISDEIKGKTKKELEEINKSKLKWLFRNKNLKGKKINLDKLKLTKESFYSITPWVEADNITKKIIKYISKPVSDIVITDATANVGGNTISFYNYGIKNVNSVEIDSLTCDYLKNNLEIYGYDTNNVICDDYLNIKDSLEQDCVFFDPPWGGKNYTNVKVLDLYLGKTNVTDIIFDLFTENKTRLVVLKAPLNYNYRSIELITKKILISDKNICGVEKDTIKRNGKPSYYIYYIYSKLPEYKLLENPEYAEMEEYNPEEKEIYEDEIYDPEHPEYDYRKSKEIYDPMNPWM